MLAPTGRMNIWISYFIIYYLKLLFRRAGEKEKKNWSSSDISPGEIALLFSTPWTKTTSVNIPVMSLFSIS